MPRKHPPLKRLSWRIEYAGYRVLEAVIRGLPVTLVDHLGSFAGFCFYASSPRYRAVVLRNLRIAYSERKNLSELRKLARTSTQRTIANFLGALKTTTLTQEEASDCVQLSGEEALLETLVKGQGAILVLAHMGNWEVLNRLMLHLPKGVRAGGIYQPLKNPLINALMLRRREQDGSELFSKKGGFHGPAGFLKSGGLLIVVADQKAARAGVPCSFFRKLTSLSPLPSILARKSGAEVFTAAITTTHPGHWELHVDSLQGPRETAPIIEALESQIDRSPNDYFWLHDRWRLDRKFPLSLRCRALRNSPAQTKPLRLLIITNTSPDELGLQDYLATRSPDDFPLAPEFLLEGSDSPAALAAPSRFSSASTREQMAASLRSLDLEERQPLELVLLMQPSLEWEKAAKLARIPLTKSNIAGRPLPDFLESLTFREKNAG